MASTSGLISGSGGENGGDDLDLVPETLGEQRTDGAVDEAGAQGLALAGAADLTTEEAAGNTPRRVHLFNVIHGEGEEINVTLHFFG